MNLKTTVALLVLAACAGGLLYTHGHLPPQLGRWTQQPISTPLEPLPDVLASLDAQTLTAIDIRRPRELTDQGRLCAAVAVFAQQPLSVAAVARLADPARKQIDADPVSLRKRETAWVMPGNWPTRRAEVNSVVDLLCGLKSRFEPLPLTDEQRYGTDTPKVVVTVKGKDGEPHSLAFSEQGTGFDRPTYLRIDDEPQVRRLGPGIVAVLERQAEYYQQRRLFPIEREQQEQNSATRVDRVKAKRVVVDYTREDNSEAKGDRQTPRHEAHRFALVHTPNGWELAEPTRDALDPGTRDRLLEALADLWAERFVDGVGAVAAGLAYEDSAKVRTTRTVTVTREDGGDVTLRIGKPTADARPVPVPGSKVRNYAKLDGYDRIFEINADKLDAIFVTADALRDTRLANFAPANAREIRLTTSKGTVVLRGGEAKKAEPSVPVPAPLAEWNITQPIEAKADPVAVEKLLAALSGAMATEKDVVERARLAGAVGVVTRAGLGALASAVLCSAPAASVAPPPTDATVEVTAEESKNGETKKKTYTVRLGRHDKAAKRLFATSQDWPRVNEIGDELAELVLDKGALDYRGKKLLDFDAKSVRRIETKLTLPALTPPVLGMLTTPPSMARLGMLPVKLPEPPRVVALQRSGSGWELVEPVKAEADGQRADELAGRLSKLDVVAWAAADAKADAAKYGLLAPALRATVSFSDEKKPARTLRVGNPRGDGPGYFAKLEDAPEVFVLPEDVVRLLGRGSLEYRPTRLWAVKSDEVARLKIARAGQAEYTLEKKGTEWEVSGPFSVKAPKPLIDRLVRLLSSPLAIAYQTHAATDFAPYGLDAPAVKVTLATKDGKEHSLWLGKESEEAPGRFARLGEKSPAVVVVPFALARAADQSALDFLDRDLLKFDPTRVSAYTRKKGGDVLELAKKDDEWRLVKPTEASADDQRVPALFEALAKLTADRIVAYAPADVKQYGLDKPLMTATIELSGEKPNRYVLDVGGEVKGYPGGRYARVQGSPIVGELSPEVLQRLSAGALAYRDHLVAKLPDAETAKLESGDRRATFAKPEGTWKLTQPIAVDADHDALEAFVTSLAKVKADEFVAEKATAAQLKEYGLDKPSVRWQFFVGDKVKLDLLIGSADREGRRYAKLNGNPLVFLLDPKVSAMAVAEYRPRAVFAESIDPAAIGSVKFGYKQGAFELKKVDGKWQVVGKEDVKVDEKALADTLAVLRDLKLERYVQDDKAQLKLYGLDPPELALVVDGKYTLHLGGLEGSSKRRYARVPGARSDVFVLDRAASAKLFRDLAALTVK